LDVCFLGQFIGADQQDRPCVVELAVFTVPFCISIYLTAGATEHSVSLFCLTARAIERFVYVILLLLQMAVAAVAHIYVYPAAPYRREFYHNLNTIDSVASELEEDIEVAATSVKESVKDVVVGGGENVSVLFRYLKILVLFSDEISMNSPKTY